MLYSLLHSNSSSDWKLHRSWILKVLLSGIHIVDDIILLQERRHVIPILMSFHDTRMADRYTRNIVLMIIEKLSYIPTSLSALLYVHSYIGWIRTIICTNNLTLTNSLYPVLQSLSTVIGNITKVLPKIGEKENFTSNDIQLIDEEEEDENTTNNDNIDDVDMIDDNEEEKKENNIVSTIDAHVDVAIKHQHTILYASSCSNR